MKVMMQVYFVISSIVINMMELVTLVKHGLLNRMWDNVTHVDNTVQWKWLCNSVIYFHRYIYMLIKLMTFLSYVTNTYRPKKISQK